MFPMQIKKTFSFILLFSLVFTFCLPGFATPGELQFIDETFFTLDEEDQAQWKQWEEEDAAKQANVAEHPSSGDDSLDISVLDPALAAQLESIDESALAHIDLTTLETNSALPEEYYNILILGLDARKDTVEDALSDVIMICSIHKKTGEIKLTSIARDTAVVVPGYKNPYKINVAYKYGWTQDPQDGGPKLAMRTVNRNFQMNIEHFMAINFFGLAAIIDSIGGVDIELSKAEANRINYELKKEPLDKVDREKVEGTAGIHHLDGMQAVAFARIRKIDNDFERTARQRRLIDALMKAIMTNMTADVFLGAVNAMLPYVYTNISTTDMLGLGLTILGSDSFQGASTGGKDFFTEFRIPMDKTYSYKDINGSSVISMGPNSLEKNITALHEFIYGQSYYEK
ncbi:MAG: hypothetical protein GX786_03295 [Clostridiales bacterium]|nr:hypothetical protein [Clostridiales bacterium]